MRRIILSSVLFLSFLCLFSACPTIPPLPKPEGQTEKLPTEKLQDDKDAGQHQELDIFENAHKTAPPDRKNVTHFQLSQDEEKYCFRSVCVLLPKGIVPKKNARLTFRIATNVPQGSLVPVMDIGPDSWRPTNSFDISFQFGKLPAGINQSDLRVAFVSKGKWVFVPTTIDSVNKIATGRTYHFSLWGLVARGGSCKADPVCHDSETCISNRCQKKSCGKDSDCTKEQVCQKRGTCELSCSSLPNGCRACQPVTETCNGKDDDCDGKVDEDLTRLCYTGKKGTKGVGVCRAGTEACTRGKWDTCLGQIIPQPEICNRRDDDCNGKTDDNCQKCTSDKDCPVKQTCQSGVCQ